MLKMLIADDEPVIIRGLQMLIDWAQLGIEICATCENGAEPMPNTSLQYPRTVIPMVQYAIHPGTTVLETKVTFA